MIAPIARTPNTSGITRVIIVSAAAKPTPNMASAHRSASRDGTPQDEQRHDLERVARPTVGASRCGPNEPR